MDKVLVKLYLPIIEAEYDVWIPVSKTIRDVIVLLSKGVNELKNGYYQPEEMPMLYNRETGKPYELDVSVQEANIKNGSELVMI